MSIRAVLTVLAVLLPVPACSSLQAAAPRAPGDVGSTGADPLPVVKELSISSRAPVINRDAWLIAGFFESEGYVHFSSIGFDNHVHEHDFARMDDPGAMARLQQAVSKYLASGVWRQMVLGTKQRDKEGATHWDMGAFSAMANADAELAVHDADGGGLAGPPSSHFPRMGECEKPFSVEVTGVAVDPKTKWIWATHRPTSPGSCRVVSMAITFQAWTARFYPTQLASEHGDQAP